MDFSLFRKIIDDASAHRIHRVFLYLHGEPFLHPQIVEMIEYIKSKRMAVTLTTNGMLLDSRIIESIFKAGVDNGDHFIFSILGFTKDVHEKIMRGVEHDRVISNLVQLLEYRKSHQINGPIIEAVMYAMPENEHEKHEFTEHWKRVVDHVRDVGSVSNQFAANYEKRSEYKKSKNNCSNLWERMTVFWNGDVTLCCADIDGKYLFGNLSNTTIEEVWNDEKYRKIQNLHKYKEYEKIALCANCDF